MLNQASSFQSNPDSLTEIFDSLASGGLPANGRFTAGTFTASNATILVLDPHGGAGAVSKYAMTEGTLSVSIPASQDVGFWWSAGNSPHTVSLYDSGATLLGTIDSASIVSPVGTPSSPNVVVAVCG